MSNKPVQYLFLGILVLTLSACGFRLRGAIELPPAMQETRIIGMAEFAPLNIQLRRLLSSAGAKVVAAGASASATLIISGEDFRKRVLSVDSQGRAAEYELSYRFSFELTAADNKVLVPRQSVELVRDYRFDPDNVLAIDAEEARIREEMYRFAANQTMRRITAVLRQQS